MIKNDSYCQVDQQLEDYDIINLTECARFVNEEYKIPSGFQCSDMFDTWLQANKYIQYLEDLKRDPSYTVSILGYYIEFDTPFEPIRIVSKVSVSYS